MMHTSTNRHGWPRSGHLLKVLRQSTRRDSSDSLLRGNIDDVEKNQKRGTRGTFDRDSIG